jgi:autotransporter-associated beta strand protein
VLFPVGTAHAAGGTDITAQVRAGGNIVVSGDSVINLPSGTTTYNGVFSGQGTLTVAGSGTLVLTKNSDFTLPAASRHQSVTTSGGNWPYPIVSNPDPPTVIVEAGATLQYGNGGATGIIGHYPYSLPGINLTLNQDNIEVDGTLVLDLNGPGLNLGTISGTGLVWQPRTAWDTLDLAGTQPFRGVIGLGTGVSFGDASYRMALPNARAILDDGSAIFFARDYTLTIPQNIYEQNYGNDVDYHTWQAGKIVMTGVYTYSDTGPDSAPALSDPSLNTAQVAHTINFRAVNIEGAHVQWGDGTTDRFFLPATPADSYINIHMSGSLAFDYDGPVTLDTPISGGVYHNSLSTPAYADVTLNPTSGNAVTFATPQNYHGTTTIGAGATLLLGTGSAGGDSALLTGTSSDAIVDDGALIARNATTALTLSNIRGTGTLTQSGAATTALTGTTAYTGATTITSGTLELGAAADGLAASSSLTLTGGTLDIATAGTDQAVNNLTGSAGDIALGAHTLTVRSTASTTYHGTFTGPGGLTKTGTGTLTLTAASTTGGLWRIAQGTLAVDGAALTTGGLTEAAGSTLTLTPSGSTPALTVNGPLNLAGTLAVKLNSPMTAGQKLTLIHQTATGPGTTGTFSGLTEGAKLTVNGSVFHISYHGGTGHDVVLTATTGTASANATAPAGDPTSQAMSAGGSAQGRGTTTATLTALAAGLAVILTGLAYFRVRRTRAKPNAAGAGTHRRNGRARMPK